MESHATVLRGCRKLVPANVAVQDQLEGMLREEESIPHHGWRDPPRQLVPGLHTEQGARQEASARVESGCQSLQAPPCGTMPRAQILQANGNPDPFAKV